jgi:hypothetical protein
MTATLSLVFAPRRSTPAADLGKPKAFIVASFRSA